MIHSISAVTLATHDMRRAVSFYRMLGFQVIYGGERAAFTSFRAGAGFLNLIAQPAERRWSWWGRLIFYEFGHRRTLCPCDCSRAQAGSGAA